MANTSIYAEALVSAFEKFTHDYNTQVNMGTTWQPSDSDMSTSQFLKFTTNAFFPVLRSINLIQKTLGDSFFPYAFEEPLYGGLDLYYIIADVIPVGINLTKPAIMNLETKYPKQISFLKGRGVYLKQKFTINHDEYLENFQNYGQAIRSIVRTIDSYINSFNVENERMVLGNCMYAVLNGVKTWRQVSDISDMPQAIFTSIRSMIKNNHLFTEFDQVAEAQGVTGRLTTKARPEDFLILTQTKVGSYILNQRLPQLYKDEGIDFMGRVIDFDNLGMCWITNEDVTISDAATVSFFENFGDYQIATGDVIPANTMFTIDISSLTEFSGTYDDSANGGSATAPIITQLKPPGSLFAWVFDVNKLVYRVNTQRLIRGPFLLEETNEANIWLHYYRNIWINPFFSSIAISDVLPAGVTEWDTSAE